MAENISEPIVVVVVIELSEEGSEPVVAEAGQAAVGPLELQPAATTGKETLQKATFYSKSNRKRPKFGVQFIDSFWILALIVFGLLGV